MVFAAHPLMVPVAFVVRLLMGLVGFVNLEERPITMLTLNTYSASSLGFRRPPVARTGLHRLFAAAIVSDQFRTTLLREPEEALAKGYLGQTFPLTDQEKKIIKTIRAENLTDFAQKVNQALKNS
ncbi:MAG TPA: hypothetical protein VLE49_03160 [Anaerolineales bacterium]|nr:hypothetical protein [Anaerolineales bacterium]